MTNGYHTTWRIPAEHRESPGYLAAGRRMALAGAVYARRSALGMSLEDLAAATGLDLEYVESIEESGVDPTMELIEILTSALHAAARIDPGPGHAIRFEAA